MHFLVGVALEAAFSSLSVCLQEEYGTISFRVFDKLRIKKPFSNLLYILLTISRARKRKDRKAWACKVPHA